MSSHRYEVRWPLGFGGLPAAFFYCWVKVETPFHCLPAGGSSKPVTQAGLRYVGQTSGLPVLACAASQLKNSGRQSLPEPADRRSAPRSWKNDSLHGFWRRRSAPRREENASGEAISDSRKIRAIRSNPVFVICVHLCPSVVELIGSKATAGKFCTRWLQARRARSDAPYHAGLAAELFDFTAHFGVSVNLSFCDPCVLCG